MAMLNNQRVSGNIPLNISNIPMVLVQAKKPRQACLTLQTSWWRCHSRLCPGDIRRQSIGKAIGTMVISWDFMGDLMGNHGDLPSGYVKIAIENGTYRNS